jgi:transmembrane sensor
MSKADYSVEDFILDLDFKGWILENDPERGAYWEDFLRKHPEKVADITLARRVLINLSKKKGQLSVPVKEELWTAISKRIADESPSAGETKVVRLNSWAAIQQYNQETARKTRIAWRRKLAAILVLFGGLGYFLWQTFVPVHKEAVPVVAEIETLQAPPGVKSTITLEDGSVVFLNSGSKISYTKGFSDSLRLVTLEGEAYFEVAHDSQRPFIVRTGSISTRALGTEFNIHSFPGERTAISLLEGEVLVRNEEADLEELLISGEGVSASPTDLEWRKAGFDPEEILSWMNKTLRFEKAPFGSASKKLEAWFGVEMKFENSIPENLHVSGKFVDESLENILKGLSYSSRFNYRIEGKKVFIQFKS